MIPDRDEDIRPRFHKSRTHTHKHSNEGNGETEDDDDDVWSFEFDLVTFIWFSTFNFVPCGYELARLAIYSAVCT